MRRSVFLLFIFINPRQRQSGLPPRRAVRLALPSAPLLDTDGAKPRLFKYCILPVRQASPHCGVASHLRSESSFSQNEPRIGVFVTSRFQRILGRT